MRRVRLLLMVGLFVVVLVAIFWVVPGLPARLLRRISGGPSYGGRSIGEWDRDLQSEQWKVRRDAVIALGRMGPDAEEAVPAVCDMLKDRSTTVRANAALALAKMFPASRGTAPQLAEALKDPAPVVRVYALLALNRMGPEARAATPALLEALRDRENRARVSAFPYSVREGAVRVLGRIGDGGPEVVAALAGALADDDAGLRAAAAEALGRIGPGAKPAAPRLRAALDDEDGQVRANARDALRRVEAPGAEERETINRN